MEKRDYLAGMPVILKGEFKIFSKEFKVSLDQFHVPPVEWADVLPRSSGPVNVRFRIKSVIRDDIMRFQSTVIPVSEGLRSHRIMCLFKA